MTKGWKHGHTIGEWHHEYLVIMNAIRRCHLPSNQAYKDYGARGITVCDRWRNDISTFFADMGHCPDGHSIERVDNNKGYSPDNCKWVPRSEQSKNRRGNFQVKLGEETMTLFEATKRTGINYETAKSRIRRGWLPEDAVKP